MIVEYWPESFVVVQLLSWVQLFVIPWTAARQASLSFTISWSLLKLMSIESVMPSNCLIHCCSLLLLPSIFPNTRAFCSSVHEILQIRILEWVAIPFSRGSSWPRDWSRVSRIVSRCFTVWATREARNKKSKIFPSHGTVLEVFCTGFWESTLKFSRIWWGGHSFS